MSPTVRTHGGLSLIPLLREGPVICCFCRMDFLELFPIPEYPAMFAGMPYPHAARIRLQNSLGSSKLRAVHLAPGWFACPQALNLGQLLYPSWNPPAPQRAEAHRMSVC